MATTHTNTDGEDQASELVIEECDDGNHDPIVAYRRDCEVQSASDAVSTVSNDTTVAQLGKPRPSYRERVWIVFFFFFWEAPSKIGPREDLWAVKSRGRELAVGV